MTGTWASGWATGDIVTAAEFKKSAGSIFDTTLGVAAANVDITSILATYAHLLIVAYARGDNVSVNVNLNMRFNGDAAANYDLEFLQAAAAAPASGEAFAQTSVAAAFVPAASAAANLFGVSALFIPHYAGTANNKSCVSMYSYKTGVATTNLTTGMLGGSWRSSAAINRVTLLPSAGNFVAGTRVTVYAMGA